MIVFFDVQEMYYLPQYDPIKKQLLTLGIECVFVLYGFSAEKLVQSKAVNELCIGAGIQYVENETEAKRLYLGKKPDWIIFGNDFSGLNDVHANSKTALIGHGIGPKSCYYTISEMQPTVRFVEGAYRKQRLEEMFKGHRFIDTGYAKLDPVINGEFNGISLFDWGLDSNKKTILYAPTFYPSSIEKFSLSFPSDFSEYNIIIKPHYFSLSNDKYQSQRARLNSWSSADNVYLAGVDELSLLPFMAAADVMISDASSALFEFAALNKPVVWCDFYQLRWGYRGPLSFRFNKRMDKDLYEYANIAIHSPSYKSLKSTVDSQVNNPDEYESNRLSAIENLAGKVDGKASERIANYLVQSV